MDDVVDIGTRRELFADGLLIGEMKGARLELAKPERREAAFVWDAPWEDSAAFSNSLVQQPGSAWLYYRAAILSSDDSRQVTALAESTDGGRSFHRPDLGLVEFEGSRHNNILQTSDPPHVPPAFVDTRPDCPADQRYKGLTPGSDGLYAMCSADGLRWRRMIEGPLEMPGAFDTINTAFWDSVAGCYRSFTRFYQHFEPDPGDPNAPTHVRSIQSSTSPDFIHWTDPVPNQYGDAEERTELYTNSTFPCPGAEHILIAFPNRFVLHRVARPQHPYPGVNDALFMASRDGVHWKRYLDAWVRPGPDERNWTERNNYPAWGIVLSAPDEWSMYITEHYRQPDVPGVLRRLAIRPHRFVSVHADYAGGEFTTRPITFGGRQLRLNYSTSAAGSLRIEIQDERGKPLKGFAAEDMEPLFGDRLDGPVAWKGGGDLGALPGRPVRLRFLLKDADVFALRTVNP